MRITTYRSDGKSANYVQGNARRAQVLAQRLDPHRIFCSGPIVIGELNPFSVLNPDDLCWIEAQSEGPVLQSIHAPGVEHVRRLAGREEYEHVLARQWPRWRKSTRTAPGDMLEALVELSFRGGHMLYLRVIGKVTDAPLTDSIFGVPAITATFDPGGMLYANPRCIVRARVYHSLSKVKYPSGLWCAEAGEI